MVTATVSIRIFLKRVKCKSFSIGCSSHRVVVRRRSVGLASWHHPLPPSKIHPSLEKFATLAKFAPQLTPQRFLLAPLLPLSGYTSVQTYVNCHPPNIRLGNYIVISTRNDFSKIIMKISAKIAEKVNFITTIRLKELHALSCMIKTMLPNNKIFDWLMLDYPKNNNLNILLLIWWWTNKEAQ